LRNETMIRWKKILVYSCLWHATRHDILKQNVKFKLRTCIHYYWGCMWVNSILWYSCHVGGSSEFNKRISLSLIEFGTNMAAVLPSSNWLQSTNRHYSFNVSHLERLIVKPRVLEEVWMFSEMTQIRGNWKLTPPPPLYFLIQFLLDRFICPCTSVIFGHRNTNKFAHLLSPEKNRVDRLHIL
jgi:hypothetical protein